MAAELTFNTLDVFLRQFAALRMHHLNAVVFWIACEIQLSPIADVKQDLDCSIDATLFA